MKKQNLLPLTDVETLALDSEAQDLHQECHSYFGSLPVIEMQQAHGASFHELIEVPTHSTVLPAVDGVITTLSGVVLAIRTADCLPILIHHPSGLIGALHAGRKGTQQGIFQKLLSYVYHEKHLTHDLQIWFGPAICETCYQVDQATDLHYSLISENIKQLESIYPQGNFSVTIDSDCTHEQPRLHSYRRDGSNSGRNYSLIAKK